MPDIFIVFRERLMKTTTEKRGNSVFRFEHTLCSRPRKTCIAYVMINIGLRSLEPPGVIYQVTSNRSARRVLVKPDPTFPVIGSLVSHPRHATFNRHRSSWKPTEID